MKNGARIQPASVATSCLAALVRLSTDATTSAVCSASAPVTTPTTAAGDSTSGPNPELRVPALMRARPHRRQGRQGRAVRTRGRDVGYRGPAVDRGQHQRDDQYQCRRHRQLAILIALLHRSPPPGTSTPPTGTASGLTVHVT
jgi:hypothetical protein